MKPDVSHDFVNDFTVKIAEKNVTVASTSLSRPLFDEVGFWRDENSQNPAEEVHGAVTPGLERVAGSMLIMISSAHRRLGLLYERHQDCFGKPDNDTLVVKGGTRQFNPTFSQAIIDKAIRRDPARYNAEYNSTWRDDLSTFLTREQLDECVDQGITVRPPIEGIIYFAACDSSSGKGDSFTMAIAHKELHEGGFRILIDYLYEKQGPKFNPAQAIGEIAPLLRQYRCTTITGDGYAAGFVINDFRRVRIEYRISQLNRSEAYLGFLPMVTTGTVRLLDHLRSINQFAGLIRKTTPSDKDKVDHEPGGHDDCSNAIALAACLASVVEQHIPLVAPIVAGIPRNIPGSTVGQHADVTDNLNSGRSTTEPYYEWIGNGGGGNRWGGT
jgi:hypothetical protein